MGVDYYFRRDDNRTRFFVGKNYALKRMLGDAPIQVSGPEVGYLALYLELSWQEEGRATSIRERGVDGYSLRATQFAREVAQWSAGAPISLVSQDGFDDWQADDAWDEDASTAEFRRETCEAYEDQEVLAASPCSVH